MLRKLSLHPRQKIRQCCMASCLRNLLVSLDLPRR